MNVAELMNTNRKCQNASNTLLTLTIPRTYRSILNKQMKTTLCSCNENMKFKYGERQTNTTMCIVYIILVTILKEYIWWYRPSAIFARDLISIHRGRSQENHWCSRFCEIIGQRQRRARVHHISLDIFIIATYSFPAGLKHVSSRHAYANDLLQNGRS